MRIAKEIYKSKKAKTLDEKMANRMATELAGAIAKGWSSPVNVTHRYTSPGTLQYRSLMDNVWQFSFAKNHEQLKATTLALMDDKGDIVPFEKFEQAARRINNGFQTTYLRTEYDTAVGGAVMADKWAQYQADAETLPLLEYVTAGDKRVRDSHRRMDGTVLPISDDFWRKYYPPNGWNCRCDAIQSLKDKPTPPNKVYTPTNKEVPPLFQTNLGESGLVFPKDHPYYEHVPEEVLKLAKNQNPFEYTKEYEGKKGGFVRINQLADMKEYRKDNQFIAELIANKGEEVFMLPTIDGKANQWAKALRELVMPTKDIPVDNKNPDAVINGAVFDFKATKEATYNAIQKQIHTASKQAKNIVLHLDNEKAKPKTIFTAIAGQLKKGSVLEEIWIIQKGKLTKYSPDNIIELAAKYKKK